MHEKTFNLGLSLAYPYESKYSIWRRFLSANQRFKLEEICEIFGIKFNNAQNRRRAPGKLFPKILQYISAPQDVPSYLELFESVERNTNFYHIVRHCPSCSASGFHTDLYRLPRLTQCPIHYKAFVAKCPKCDQDWPRWNEIGKRKCPVCGLINLATKSEYHLRLTQSDFHSIERLMEFVSFRPLNSACLRSERTLIVAECKSVSYFHKSFPAVQSARFSRYQQQFQGRSIIGSATKITTYKAPLLKIENLISRNIWTEPSLRDNPDPRLEVQQKVFRKIAGSIWTAPTEGHQPRLYNVALLNPKDLLGSSPLCLHCLALSFWLAMTESVVAAENVRYLEPNHSMSWIKINDRSVVPKYWDHLVSSGSYYKIDSKLSSDLYAADLEHLYMSLLLSFRKAQSVKKHSKEMLQVVWSRIFRDLADQFSLFFEHEDNALHLFAIDRYSLSEEALLTQSMCSKQCEAFECYLYGVNLYSSLASKLDIPEINVQSVFEDSPINFFDRRFKMPALRLSQCI